MSRSGGAHGVGQGWTRRQAHSSERASFHDENWAGDAVTVQRERSLTLICDETWACKHRKGAALRARQGDIAGVEKRIP